MVLALICWISSTSFVYAHALPGSVLTFSQQSQANPNQNQNQSSQVKTSKKQANQKQLILTIRFSLEDLLIAAPELNTLKSAPLDLALSTENLARLNTYFKQHLALKHQEYPLSLTLINASLQTDYNEHVGNYLSVVSQFSVATPTEAVLTETKLFPLSLRYDAIMHEVRTHRASVYWTQTEGEVIGIRNFGFTKINGKQTTQLLNLP